MNLAARPVTCVVALAFILGPIVETAFAAAEKHDDAGYEKAEKKTEHAWNQYAVKYVCGKPLPADRILNRGRYFTAVNVHNPELERSVALLWKVAVALPRLEEGPISKFREKLVQPDAAFEIDCPTILEIAGGGTFSKGFVVLLTKEELDVVAVYTAGREPAQIDEVVSIHTERVGPRRVYGVPAGIELDADACYGPNCCCSTSRSLSNPALTWPGCADPDTDCKTMKPGGVFHPGVGARINVSVCQPRNQPLYVPAIHPSQPPFCRDP